MNTLFGKERANSLRERLDGMKPWERELAILEAIVEALQELGGHFVLPFTFKNEDGTRTSHHLIFVSKSFKGYEIMKEIMAKQSTLFEQGVPSFVYNPADDRFPTLFELSRPIDDLAGMLLKEFAGASCSVRQIYEQHSVGKRYVLKNYKEALRGLEAKGAIIANPPADKRPMRNGERTFADKVVVKFPKEKDGWAQNRRSNGPRRLGIP